MYTQSLCLIINLTIRSGLFKAMVDKNEDISDLITLVPDTKGIHSSYILGETESPYGFYIYIPGGYEDHMDNYPLLIFLHGDGERGNSAEQAEKLEYVTYYGPPRLIQEGKWNPSHPMIVATPQSSDERWDLNKVGTFIKYIQDTKEYSQDFLKM